MSSSKHSGSKHTGSVAVHHCTVVPGCKFQTSNPFQWKRHEVGGDGETSQGHPNLPSDFYYCGFDYGDNTFCKDGFYKEEDYDDHVRVHSRTMPTTQQVYEARYESENSLLPGEGIFVGSSSGKYYCRFCWEVWPCIIENMSWECERAIHVSMHFTGGYPQCTQKTMEDWHFIPLVEDVQKTLGSQNTS